MYYFRPGIPSSWACNAFFHASLNPKLLEANLGGVHWGKNFLGHVSEKFMPGMFFCSGTIRTERPGEDWVWDEKNSRRAWNFDFHARHDFFSRLNPVFSRSSHISCPAWNLALHARHENRLFMPGMKIDFVWPVWKLTPHAGHENQLENCLVFK